jgi:hypothetical protein
MLHFALLLLASARASSFYTQPFPDTVRNTPTIVRGKVGKTETDWATLPDGSKHIFTYYDVEVSEGFKGDPRTGAPIRIRELGGSKDGVALNVSGTAAFDKGEDVVVMLGEANPQVDGAYPVLGMMMAKFNLEKGADGKEYLRGPGLGSDHPGMANEHSGGQQSQISLDGLRDIIRTQSASAKSPSPKPSAPIGDGLLFSHKSLEPVAKTEFHDENLGAPKPKSDTPMRPEIFALGAAVGVAWFLKSRKKRR